MESRNAKFLENDLISGSDHIRNNIPEHDHAEFQPPTSNNRLVIVHNIPQVPTGVEQPINEVPQAVGNIPVDQVVQELPAPPEQPVE